jgi:hypothetical protein
MASFANLQTFLRKVAGLWVLLALTVGVLAQPAEQLDEPDIEQALADHAARLEPFVTAIREAETLRTAARAYSRGNAIDSQYVPLHQAYMERMLTLGFPKIAGHPARMLVRIDPDNGMAWGVLGYLHGREKELAEAMSASVRAAKLKPGDPSIMNNLGQLLAWYRQVLALPDLPDRDKRAIDQLEDQWTQNAMFTRAYNRIHVAFEEQKQLDSAAAEKLAEAEAAVLALHRHAITIDARLTQVRQNIIAHKRLLALYRREYRRSTDAALVIIDDDDDDDDDAPLWYYRYYHGPRLSTLRRAELQALMIEEQNLVDDLREQEAELYGQSVAAQAALSDKREQLADVRDRSEVIRDRLLKQFRWDPPAVDGVVTDERDVPLARRATQPVPQIPVDAETQAAQKLSLAKAYLASNFTEKGRDILTTLVKNWPQTAAAQEARKLLGE